MTGDARNYPPPKVPIIPVLTWASFRDGPPPKDHVPFILEAGTHVKYVTSGRVALAKGLMNVGVGAGAHVLVPAYHCTSLVDPVSWLGATPVFYRVREDLSVDLEDVDAKLTASTRTLIVVHYFGFPQREIERIAQFCKARSISLIEDCAHAAFGQYNAQALGTFGDCAIASPAKFFPILDGGYLLEKKPVETNSLHNGSLAFQIKSLVNPIEKSVAYGHLAPLNGLLGFLFRIKDLLWSWRKGAQSGDDMPDSGTISPDSADGGFVFDPSWIDVRMSRGSRFLVRRLSKLRVVAMRRRIYRRLSGAFMTQPGCRVLIESLPPQVVPYVFPLYIDNAVPVFDRLKREGVPIYRWDELRTDACEVSARMSIHLFQFPCHQELTERELDWVIERVRAALQQC